MRVNFVNGGRKFLPATTFGELEDAVSFTPEKPGDDVRFQAMLLLRVLQRTDPSVTMENIRSLPSPHVAWYYAAMFREMHQAARGEKITEHEPSPIDAASVLGGDE